jgi:hypothetical protein
LEHLEGQLNGTQTSPNAELCSEEDWLRAWEAWGQGGFFDGELDFPFALASFRRAMEKAAAGTDPPFDPPPDFLPDYDRRMRPMRWRDKCRFPAVHVAFDWLLEMTGRVLDGIPPLTEAEFGELVEWFRRNDERLYSLSQPSQLLDLANGRKTSTADIRHGLAKGTRAFGVGRLAEDIRQLRARYG